MSDRSNKLLLTFHTVKYLKLSQWLYRAKNALLGLIYKKFPDTVRNRLVKKIPTVSTCTRAEAQIEWFRKTHDEKRGMFCREEILKNRYTFLHQTKLFEKIIVWKNPDFTYLWDFNLHYFEYLNCLSQAEGIESDENSQLRSDVITKLIEGWIDCNPCPDRPAWHPYVISLRTINWIKLFSNHREYADDKTLASLYLQLLFLEKNLEGHLQVNHLLENGRALLFGGLFFESHDAARWYKKGLSILKEEVEEEFLPEGGHFERSPMYHCILTEGLLDTYAYLSAMGEDGSWLKEKLLKMCSWVENIRCPDNSFPLFNDAAFGISSMPDEILNNAKRMIGFKPQPSLPKVRNCDDFHVLDSTPFFCAVDGAPVGPSYNPGHAHSDNLSYELFFKGKHFIVDSGTYAYDNDVSRYFFRSTANHNTLVINGLEQSQVWGGFRVAKRSNPVFSKARQTGQNLLFQGIYKNRVEASQQISHERIIAIKPSAWILIWDTVKAKGQIKTESHCHFAPEWDISKEKQHFRIVDSSDNEVYCLPLGVSGTTITESLYAPEFGKSVPTKKLTFTADGKELLETGYVFALEAKTMEYDFRVKRSDKRLTIHTGNDIIELNLWC